MKKTLIAGAASIALAAMPVVGVFADTSVEDGGTLTDNFSFSIGHECSFSRVFTDSETSNGHPAGTWNPTNTNSDKISIDGTAGNAYSLGSSKFNVICNGASGYKVTAYVTNLTTGDDTIEAGDTAITAGTFDGTNSSWTATNGSVYATKTTDQGGTIVASSDEPTPNAGQSFTMTYAVALADGQASGTYEGAVQYTLTDMNPGA